jgi:hypothetical protein
VEGFQELWVRVDRAFEIGTVRGADVRAVRRSPRGVEVEYAVDGAVRTERFDKLVLACPLQDTLSFLDVSAAEERLFQKIHTNDYYVTVARVRGMEDISTYLYPYARRFTPGQPTVFYPPIKAEEGTVDDGVFVFYAYGGPGVDEATVRANIQTAVSNTALGGEVEAFLHTQHWRYFPHVDSPSMLGGFYDDLEALQGQFHTYYTGELLAFTLVELIYDYSRGLVDRFFTR